MPKRTVLDPQGQTIQHALSGLGYKQIRDVRQGKFFVLNLDGWSRDEAQSQLERISKEVLTANYNWPLIGIVFGSSCFYAAIALGVAVAAFKSESVLFRT